MLPSSGSPYLRRRAAWWLTVVLLSSGSAIGYGGFTVGLSGGVPTGGPYVLNVRAVQPFAGATLSGTPLSFSARADLATLLSFDTVPAVGIGVVTSATAEGIERYMGVGGGVSPAGDADAGASWSVYGLAGYRVPITSGLHGALEVQIARTALFTAPRVGLALEYTFGGER